MALPDDGGLGRCAERGILTRLAGIENELFHDPKTQMLFSDAKDSLSKLIGAVRAA